MRHQDKSHLGVIMRIIALSIPNSHPLGVSDTICTLEHLIECFDIDIDIEIETKDQAFEHSTSNIYKHLCTVRHHPHA